ncbi:MAG: DUF815 domain-containing protein [Ruminiclostridium sp.]|nr:DUF815 domain-containing protein [Ruminiclostridium sp.]
MKDLKLLISSLVTSQYKNDELIRCISDIFSDNKETAIRSYCRVCEILLCEGKSLSDYISSLTVRDDNALFTEYLRTHSELLRYNIRHDFTVLTSLSKISSYEFVGLLRERFQIPENVPFPMYENGSAEISFEEAEKYIALYGSAFLAYNKAFIYENNCLTGIEHFDKVKLSDLKNYELQRNAVIENTRRFIEGKRYSNVLLYGDRGTGKSCTVKAVVNEFQELRIVLVPKSSVPKLYDLFELLRGKPLKFILFLDDISFEDGDPDYAFFKQVLEGSVSVMPSNCAIYATTNRRHIIKETSDEHSNADARDEKASLADRFGLYITFMSPDKRTYLDIVEKIAADRNIEMDREELALLAERFAVRKGNRSPRTAKQFLDSLEK